MAVLGLLLPMMRTAPCRRITLYPWPATALLSSAPRSARGLPIAPRQCLWRRLHCHTLHRCLPSRMREPDGGPEVWLSSVDRVRRRSPKRPAAHDGCGGKPSYNAPCMPARRSDQSGTLPRNPNSYGLLPRWGKSCHTAQSADPLSTVTMGQRESSRLLAKAPNA